MGNQEGRGNDDIAFDTSHLEDDFVRYHGDQNESMIDLFRRSKLMAVNIVIRPKKSTYTVDMLGPIEFDFEQNRVVRTDVDLYCERTGFKIVCSFWRLIIPVFGQSSSCVLFLHSNLGNRTKAVRYLRSCLKSGFSLFSFDFPGTGQSEGDFITLGEHEALAVKTAVDYLSTEGIERVILFGHSLGAVSALTFFSRYSLELLPSSDRTPLQLVKAMILDSPYSSINDMADDMIKTVSQQGIHLPSALIKLGIRFIRSDIVKIIGIDPFEVDVSVHAGNCTVPCLIASDPADSYVRHSQVLAIAQAYYGDVTMVHFRSGHFEDRPIEFVNLAREFICKFGVCDGKSEDVDFEEDCSALAWITHHHPSSLVNSNSSILKTMLIGEIESTDSIQTPSGPTAGLK